MLKKIVGIFKIVPKGIMGCSMSEIKKDNELQVTKLSDLTPEKLAAYEKRTVSFSIDDLLVFYKTEEVQGE